MVIFLLLGRNTKSILQLTILPIICYAIQRLKTILLVRSAMPTEAEKARDSTNKPQTPLDILTKIKLEESAGKEKKKRQHRIRLKIDDNLDKELAVERAEAEFAEEISKILPATNDFAKKKPLAKPIKLPSQEPVKAKPVVKVSVKIKKSPARKKIPAAKKIPETVAEPAARRISVKPKKIIPKATTKPAQPSVQIPAVQVSHKVVHPSSQIEISAPEIHGEAKQISADPKHLSAQQILDMQAADIEKAAASGEEGKRDAHNLLKELKIITAILLGKNKNKELAQVLDTDKSFTSKQIKGLEEKGLVKREGSGRDVEYSVDNFNVMKFLQSKLVVKWKAKETVKEDQAEKSISAGPSGTESSAREKKKSDNGGVNGKSAGQA